MGWLGPCGGVSMYRPTNVPGVVAGSVQEADPHPQAVDLATPGHALLVPLPGLVGRPGAGGQVAQHLRVGVELDLEVQVLVGERHQGEALGVEDRLGHGRECVGHR